VRRCHPAVRPAARYERSMQLLQRVKAQGRVAKTGIMVGIGERPGEVEELLQDLVDGVRVAGVSADNPQTNVANHWVTPDPNRAIAQRASAQGVELTPGMSAHRSIGEDKPDLGDKLRRGGYLVAHDNPFWDHDGPVSPPAMQARIAEVSYPGKTYPRIHETLDILTIGQYLQPTRNHLPISHWVTPAEFVEYKRLAESMGVRHCESGPLVRSSYHADEQVLKMQEADPHA